MIYEKNCRIKLVNVVVKQFRNALERNTQLEASQTLFVSRIYAMTSLPSITITEHFFFFVATKTWYLVVQLIGYTRLEMFHLHMHLNSVTLPEVMAIAYQIHSFLVFHVIFFRYAFFPFEFAGRYGFLLPANYIIPNAEETIDGLKAMIKKAKSLKAL